MQTPAELARFVRPGLVRIDAGPGGFTRVTTTTALGRTEAVLHGAHLTGWEPAGQAPVIWMTGQAVFKPATPIRGGVPICWPWFGPAAGSTPDKPLPMHGPVRTQTWTLDDVRVDGDGVAVIELSLASGLATRASFPHDFRLRYRITAGRSLELSLTATNTGAAPFPVAEALHTYLGVGDIRRTEVAGLEGSEFLDRSETRGYHLLPVTPRARQAGTVAFTEEVDRHYPAHAGEVTVRDPDWNRVLRIAKRGSASTQVWNPWIAKAQRLADLGDHEWPAFLAVEAANAFDAAYVLAPGQSHELVQSISVL